MWSQSLRFMTTSFQLASLTRDSPRPDRFPSGAQTRSSRQLCPRPSMRDGLEPCTEFPAMTPLRLRHWDERMTAQAHA
jgi:hypothetical protein